MSLVKCKECNAQMSDKAVACPQCGAKYTRTSGCAMIAAWLIGLGVLMSIVTNYFSTERQNESDDAERARVASLNPQQRKIEADQKAKSAAEETTRKNAEKGRLASGIAGASLLKKSLRDPDSFKLEKASIVEGTNIACYTYRARNGFGGLNVENAVFVPSKLTFKTSSDDNFASLWNRECANKSSYDYLSEVKVALSLAE